MPVPEPFYGPPYDFRPTPEAVLWVNYYTNPFIDNYEKIELHQWLHGLPPTYGEWYYQYAERIGLENSGATTQPNPDDDSELLKQLSTFAIVGLVLYGVSVFSKVFLSQK